MKINVTNGYSGSLAWLNAYTRVTRRYPGRTVFVLFNLAIAYCLMMMDVFGLMSFVLSLYANFVMAWLVTISADIVFNKYLLRLSPMRPEFRRGMLHNWNPVGLVSVSTASVLSLAAFFGLFGAGSSLRDPDLHRCSRPPHPAHSPRHPWPVLPAPPR